MPILQGSVLAILSQTNSWLEAPNTDSHNSRLSWDPSHILQKTFWVSAGNAAWVKGKFQAWVSGRLQKCRPRSSAGRHRPLLRKWFSTFGCAGIKESRGDRNGLSTVQWDGLLAESTDLRCRVRPLRWAYSSNKRKNPILWFLQNALQRRKREPLPWLS